MGKVKRVYDPGRAEDQARMFGPDDPRLGEAWIQSAMRRDPNHELAFRVYRQIRDQVGKS